MTNSDQMELIPSTSLQEDTHANPSLSLANKKALKIRDTSGQSILDLSKNVGQLGLLERMLVDTLNSVSTKLSRTWKVKVTPRGHLVFQLLASVRTTKEKESGLWLTPSATTISKRSQESMEKRKKYRESIGRTTVPPGNLAEQVQYGKPVTEMVTVPTPTATDFSKTTATYDPKAPSLSGRTLGVFAKTYPENNTWPTPTAGLKKHSTKKEYWENRIQKGRQNDTQMAVYKSTGSGTLNPTWVEWLMGYPLDWTDLNHSETVSYLKSPTTSDKPSSERWPTPTAADGHRREKLETWKARKKRLQEKGVNLHRPLDIAVLLDKEKDS